MKIVVNEKYSRVKRALRFRAPATIRPILDPVLAREDFDGDFLEVTLDFDLGTNHAISPL